MDVKNIETLDAADAGKSLKTSNKDIYAVNKILLVEDDIHISEVIHDYFVRAGGGKLQVVVKDNGTDGLDSFLTDSFDLVLLDIMLPGMDGFSICREMRRHSMVPILFLTARDSEWDIMLDNLIMNTVKYAPDNSIVSVTIDGGKFVISNDMDGEIDCDPSELWEPMKKGNSARTGHTGNGLGLSIVKKILDLSGFTGNIAVEDGKFVVTISWSK